MATGTPSTDGPKVTNKVNLFKDVTCVEVFIAGLPAC